MKFEKTLLIAFLWLCQTQIIHSAEPSRKIDEPWSAKQTTQRLLIEFERMRIGAQGADAAEKFFINRKSENWLAAVLDTPYLRVSIVEELSEIATYRSVSQFCEAIRKVLFEAAHPGMINETVVLERRRFLSKAIRVVERVVVGSSFDEVGFVSRISSEGFIYAKDEKELKQFLGQAEAWAIEQSNKNNDCFCGDLFISNNLNECASVTASLNNC